MRAVSFVILLLLSSSALADDREKLLGNWKLVSFFTEDIQTKQRSNVFGEHPNGFIGFTPERFFAVAMAEGRKAPQRPKTSCRLPHCSCLYGKMAAGRREVHY